MGKFNNLTGKKFGDLTVVSMDGRTETTGGTKFYTWLCRCECGGEKICRSNNLVSGRNVSCGCRAYGHEKHGLAGHPLYKIWVGMNQRCNNENHQHYADYGGRGIEVCREWRDGPEAFIDHMLSLGWEPRSNLSIDRKNNDLGYSPGNTRLATKTQQSRNQRRNTIIEFDGRKASLAEWAEETGIPYATLQTRIFRGWSADRALTTMVSK